MIIIEVAGGLGNQLQQYALYKKFQSLGKEVRLDIFMVPGRKSEQDACKKGTGTELL